MGDPYKVCQTVLGIVTELNKGGKLFVRDKKDDKKDQIKKLTELVGNFTVVGGIILHFWNIFKPGKPDPVIAKLKEISDKLDKLDRKIDESVKAIKSVLLDHDFTKLYINRAATLLHLLGDVMRTGSRSSIETFKSECSYCKTNPYTLIVDMRQCVFHESTSPVASSVRANIQNSRALMRHWEDTINLVINRLVLLDGIWMGMQGQDRGDSMAKTVSEFTQELSCYCYSFDTDYWPKTVEDIYKDVVDNNQHVGNQAKADIFKKRLDLIHTRDIFYIVVYNDVSGYDSHAMTYDDDHAFVRFRRGKCNVVLYRKKFGDLKDNRLQGLINFAKKVDYVSTVKNGAGLLEVTRELWKEVNHVGLILVIRRRTPDAVAIRWTGMYEWGPGWWRKVKMCCYTKWYGEGTGTKLALRPATHHRGGVTQHFQDESDGFLLIALK